MTQEETELYRKAKEALLRRVVDAAEEGSTGSVLLTLAEAYAVIATRSPSGRINAPKS